MKRKIYLLGIALFAIFLIAGCGKESKSVGHTSMYDNLKVSKETYSLEEIQKFHTAINSWAKECLLVSNNMDSDAVDKAEKKLCNYIDSGENLKAIKADYKKLYSDGTVTISNINTNIKEVTRAKYKDQDVGKVICDIVITGQKNGEAFTRTYDLILVVSINKNKASVREVGEIAWKDA